MKGFESLHVFARGAPERGRKENPAFVPGESGESKEKPRLGGVGFGGMCSQVESLLISDSTRTTSLTAASHFSSACANDL